MFFCKKKKNRSKEHKKRATSRLPQIASLTHMYTYTRYILSVTSLLRQEH